MMTDKTKNNNQSNLFYLDNIDRPELDRAEGIYLWDTNGKKYIDASSGPMVSISVTPTKMYLML